MMIPTALSTFEGWLLRAGGGSCPGHCCGSYSSSASCCWYAAAANAPPWTGGSRETGIDVLERRFAEGALSLEEYRERRSVLEEKR